MKTTNCPEILVTNLDPITSEFIQKKSFECGFTWYSKEKECRYTDTKRIVITRNGREQENFLLFYLLEEDNQGDLPTLSAKTQLLEILKWLEDSKSPKSVTQNISFTVNSLKQQGYKVIVKHYRRVIGDKNKLVPIGVLKSAIRYGLTDEEINPRGGKTMVILFKDEKKYQAEEVCSDKDVFNKRIGIDLAAKKALKV